MAERRPSTSREKVKAYRDRLRSQGLRPIQIWVPDVRAPEFEREARRQSRLIANSPQEQEDLDFIDSIAALNDSDDRLGEA